MKTLVTMTALWVVLGLCLPSSGEILVYKSVNNGTWFENPTGEWEPHKYTNDTGYVVVDLDYDNYTIGQVKTLEYYRDEDGKWFDEGSAALELVRVPYGTKVQWIVMFKQVTVEGGETTGVDFEMWAGHARNRSIGAQENREVANKLTGYGLLDVTDGEGREIDMWTTSFTLHPSWTRWANAQGNPSVDATLQMIKDYLIGKGYQPQPT
jgi:hypothetical protein